MKVTIKSIEYYLPPTTEDGNALKKENPDWSKENSGVYLPPYSIDLKPA
jgi:transposase